MVLYRVTNRLIIKFNSHQCMHAYLVVDLYITAMMVDAKTAAENTTVHTTRVAMMATTAELSDATAVPSLSD